MRMWPWRRRARFFTIVLSIPLMFMVIILISLQSDLTEEDSDVSVLLRQDSKQKEYIDKKGIHVIVGHYIGNDLPWDTTPNLTNELLNKNGYSPLPSAGDMGQAYFVLPGEKNKAKTLYHINKFNLLVSDRIPLNRSLPDVRRQACRKKFYDMPKLPDTSVIIVYHNEAWSTLLRTVHSIINRSPKNLIKEIILVDDASNRDFLREPLDKYVSKLPVRVKIVRSQNRTGLIRARLLGANIAEGQILTFLDAHCECTEGWLEPLLTRIADNRTNVVCPVIDIINDDTFAYVRSFEMHWGAFNWDLHFRWYAVGAQEIRKRKDTTLPFRTPVMAGGLFSIDRSYFEEIGRYDDQMDIWGGENIELSFRVWQCGGSVEIVPCSHVGHVFRRSSPYTFPRAGGVGAVLYRNLARAASTWMDDWKTFYFKMNPEAEKASRGIDVSSRLQLRKQLKCKSFQWYLENVWPEHFLPTEQRFFGKIRNKKSSKCLQTSNSKNSGQQPVGKLYVKPCVFETYARQLFIFTKKGRIMTDESVCLDSLESRRDSYVLMIACNDMVRQSWKYDIKKQSIIHSASNLCLDEQSKTKFDAMTLQECNGSRSQQWQFESVIWNS